MSDDVIAEAVAIERNGRQWLAARMKSIEVYTRESGCEELVQAALDDLAIAAARRATRILMSDSGPGDASPVESATSFRVNRYPVSSARTAIHRRAPIRKMCARGNIGLAAVLTTV